MTLDFNSASPQHEPDEPPGTQEGVRDVKLCSGIGQWHSINNKTNPQDYLTTTLSAIENLRRTPYRLEKENAHWVIFSTLLSRVHSEQRNNGLFYALWADLDKLDGLTYPDIISRTDGAGIIDYMLYTSKSATEQNPKSRLIIPLSEPVPGERFIILQKILNDKLEAIELPPDRATERAGQVCYLPNRGKYYNKYKGPLSKLFNPSSWGKEEAQERKRIQAQEKALSARQEQARLKAVQRMATGCKSPIEAFNAEYSIADCLERYGAMKDGDRWLSPNSESGKSGITITADSLKWLSTHESDNDIGIKTKNGTMGDAFDLFTYYEHKGDRTAAIKAAGDMFTVGGKTITKANQIEYMEAKAREETLNAFDDASCQEPQGEGADTPRGKVFSLSQFSLNGTSQAMEAKMQEDRFILKGIAILGQSTAIYAKSNAGKTLLTISMLIQAIESGDINGEDVFYINADDDHKGLTYKLKLAEKYKFHMLAPGYPKEKPFEPKHLGEYLKAMITTGTANGKTIVLDTVKKFTSIMQKELCSQFGTDIRNFISHGGSTIMLAHANKYKDVDGKIIPAGTSDLVDDADCAYTINILSEDIFTSERTVQFNNFKNRGDVLLEATFSYNYDTKADYTTKLASIKSISADEQNQQNRMNELYERYKRNQTVIDAIKECLSTGDKKQKEIIKELDENYGISRRQVQRVLKEHQGLNIIAFQFWDFTAIGDKNAKVYHLNK